MDQLAIDIHSNKLLDWLVSRRHCQHDWIKHTTEIREKIKLAILDMPENERIVDLLRGGSINYFHCKEIVDILKETEKDTKNMFGSYSSQRMKDWQQILSLYQKNNIYLAESAQLLQRLVHYEIPALRRGITKAENNINEAQKKEKDLAKQASDAKNAYEKELKKFGITGENVRNELIDLAKDLLSVFDGLARKTKDFEEIFNYYEAVKKHSGIEEESLVLLKKLSSKGKDFTVFEQKTGKIPERIERIQLEKKVEEVADDEIDFGDDIDFGDEIDFGDDIAIEVIGDETGEQSNAGDAEDNIARYENAFSIFEFQQSFMQIQAELEELLVFIQFRISDEKTEDPSHIYIASYDQKPKEIEKISVEILEKWRKTLESFQKDLNDPLTRHLAKIRASPGYVDDLTTQLDNKRKQEGRYKQMEVLARERQEKLTQEIQENSERNEVLADSARELQGQIEDSISELYKGREVNIVGEIATILYD